MTELSLSDASRRSLFMVRLSASNTPEGFVTAGRRAGNHHRPVQAYANAMTASWPSDKQFDTHSQYEAVDAARDLRTADRRDHRFPVQESTTATLTVR